MAEYSNLSATINAQIRANGVQAITGPVLNAVLTAMVNVLGDGYRLNGVAVPADNPGSPDNRVAYLAAQDGTYTNFGGLTISGEVALLLWDSAWTKATLFSIDTAVTPGSGNLVTSGAVDDALTTLANNIAAAYMQLVPAATEGNLAEFDNAGQVRDAGIATTDLATKDGHYPDLFAGFAGNLVDTRSAGTRQGPFAFRQSGGDGVNYMRKILGRTEAWNQIININAWAGGSDAGTTLTVVDGKVRINGTATQTYDYESPLAVKDDFVQGHKYILRHRGSADIGGAVEANGVYPQFTPNADVFLTVNTVTGRSLFVEVTQGVTYNNAEAIFEIFDLTLMYGAGNEPSTVAEFEALHPLGYYNYNAGVLKNNAATGLETTGFNQWDEVWEVGGINGTDGTDSTSTTWSRSKNYVKVLGSTLYYVEMPASLPFLYVYQYDANNNYLGVSERVGFYASGTFTTSANAAYIRISWQGTTYNHDICINISDPSRNGIYEPYWKREIVLGLDNIACHDENDNAVVVNGLDGVGTSQDEAVVENGMVTKINKKMEEVDLGNLSWNDAGGQWWADINALGRKYVSGSLGAGLICSRYTPATGSTWAGWDDKSIGGNTSVLRIQDSAFTGYTSAQVAAALAGVKLRYELATPKVLTLDNPIPALIEVDNLGTEKRLPEDTADNPQAPFECDSNYSVSTANLVRLLNL